MDIKAGVIFSTQVENSTCNILPAITRRKDSDPSAGFFKNRLAEPIFFGWYPD